MNIRQIAVLVAFVTAACSCIAQLSSGGVLPTNEEIQGLQTLCGGSIQALKVTGNVDAAIKSWKKASVGADVEVAKKNLIGVYEQLKGDPNIAGVADSYVRCVTDNLQKFLDREAKKPRPVSREGQSNSLLRSAFDSDEAIRKAGCSEAEADARRKLDDDCRPRLTSILRTLSCSSTSGSPRTYTLRVDAECRFQ